MLAAALKTIYRAAPAAAEAALDAFEAGPWGEKYPAIARSWRSAWEHVVPFFAFSGPIHRAVYTTKVIESLNTTVRRAVRSRDHFPNDCAATMLLYLALRGVQRNWRAPPLFWYQVRPELAIRFGERFAVESSSPSAAISTACPPALGRYTGPRPWAGRGNRSVPHFGTVPGPTPEEPERYIRDELLQWQSTVGPVDPAREAQTRNS